MDDHPLLENNYVIVREIGKGLSSVIYLVRDRNNNYYAAKIPINNTFSESLILQAKSFAMLSTLNTRYFPKYYGLYYTRNGLPVYVMEYINGNTLDNLIDINRNKAVSILKDIVDAMNILHRNSMVCGDLDSTNVMIVVVDDEAVLIDINGIEIEDLSVDELEELGIDDEYIDTLYDNYTSLQRNIIRDITQFGNIIMNILSKIDDSRSKTSKELVKLQNQCFNSNPFLKPSVLSIQQKLNTL